MTALLSGPKPAFLSSSGNSSSCWVSSWPALGKALCHFPLQRQVQTGLQRHFRAGRTFQTILHRQEVSKLSL